MKSIRRGQRGTAVNDVQRRLHELGYDAPGFSEETGQQLFGEVTEKLIRDFQEDRGLRATGEVDDVTWQELVEASYRLGDRFLYLREPLFRGDDVREIQRYLNRLGFHAGREDGIFGQQTDQAVRAFQRNLGLPVDGIVGSSTIEYLLRLERAMKPTSVAAVHERIQDEVSLPLEGRKVFLDAGNHAFLKSSLFSTLRDLLIKERAQPFSLEPQESLPSEHERAYFANQQEAEVALSIHLLTDHQPVPLRTYYFAGKTYISPRGLRLAQLILNALSPLGYSDRVSQGKSFPLLRETRMTCVVVELPGLLSEEVSIAAAFVDALRQYFQ
jgi:N-acetylmuramoyl-L-alanine amidase